MTPPSEASAVKAEPAVPEASLTRASVSRPSSRRSLRTSDGSAAHPLSAPSTDGQGQGQGQYPVYSPGKKRSLVGGSGLPAHSASSLSPGEGSPLSPSPSSGSAGSTLSSPPFAPTTSAFLPPLVSRPSNSTLPSPSGRHYARSVSEAKEQLQRQALKAELQSLGLGAESAGAALVARLASVGDEADLKGLQDLIASGKTTLLLPAEKLDSPAQLTPAFLLDHLVLLDAPESAGTSSHLVVERGFGTLGGIRGVLTGGELVFTSCGGIVLDEGKNLDFTQEETLRTLRGVSPLRAPPPGTTYPSTMLISAITTLSIPLSRVAPSTSPVPPPTNRTTSRLAALFAKQAPAASDSADLPPVVPAPAGLLSGESPSVSENEHNATRKAASLDVPVLAVGKVIRRAEVIDAVTNASAAHILRVGAAVEGTAGEADVLGDLAEFATRLGPPTTAAGAMHTPATGAATAADNLFGADPADLADAFQDAMHNVRLNLTRNLGSPPASAAARSGGGPGSPAVDATPALEDFTQLEERVDAALERLEDLATAVLHDRLFAPRGARDLQEDENLASRVAALNVLELGLDHLGIDLGDDGDELPGWEGRSSGARESLEDLAGSVGRQLNRLEDPQERTPSAKLAILVECHKVLVDGLSKLPPVPLKKDLDEADKGSLSDQPAEVEMDDASSRSSSLPPSRAMSPPPADAKQMDDELLKTPRAPLSSVDRDVPEIQLPAAGVPHRELSASVLEATSSSLLEHAVAAPSPPTSIFETKRRPASVASATATSSADLILPLLIYSVVRANPPHLVSHLHFVHRFRSESLLRGQSSFCATNFDAVVEFLNHVDVSSLGLSSQKLLGAASPAPSLASPSLSSPLSRPRAHTTPSLIRARVSTTADQLVGTANSALTGVVSSSYHMLFGPKGLSAAAPRSLEDVKSVLEGARGRARESLPFRRSTSTHDAGADTLGPIGTRTSRAATLALDGDEKALPLAIPMDGVDKSEEMVDFIPASLSGTPSVPTSTADAYAPPLPPPPPRHPRTLEKDVSVAAKDDDARSVRSVSSFLNFRESTLGRALGEVRDGVVGAATTATGSTGAAGEERYGSFSGRLAGLPGLHRFGSGGAATSPTPSTLPAQSTSPASSRRSTLLNPLGGVGLSPWAPSAPAPTATAMPAIPPALRPNQRFLEVASASELKLGEVQALLDEYKRIARAVVDAQAGAAAPAQDSGAEGTDAKSS
ncbi:hypothetical protein JCM3770_001573 [Rhodotorula araucariae]